MSVINKMLRDLDSRQNPSASAGRASAAATANSTDFVRPTASADSQGGAAQSSFMPRRVGMALVAVALVLGSVAVGWWLLGRATPMQPALVATSTKPVGVPSSSAPQNPAVAEPAPASVLAAPSIAPALAASAAVMNEPAPIPNAMAPAVVPPSVSVATVVPAPSFTPAAPAAAPVLPSAALPAASSAVSASPAIATPAKPSATQALPATMPPIVLTNPRVSQAAPVLPPSAVAAASGPGAGLSGSAPPQSSSTSPVQSGRSAPTQEILAQAQTLWNSGARAGAVELLREAVAPTERAAVSAGANAAPASAATVALVRELTRMELAEGRPAPVLTLLTHLEPVIATQADLWAVRGNAAQRLGRHAESVAAYQTALKLRPAEARWMLGAAVSLAIQGQITEATDLAEQARQQGGLSPDVRGYLRQLGVILREP